MADTERRRNRPTISCTLCRKRKQRCNRESPCSNCLRSRNGICVYENHPSQAPRQQPRQVQPSQQPVASTGAVSSPSEDSTAPGHTSTSLGAGSTSASNLTAESSISDPELIKSQIRQLEEQLSNASRSSLNPSTPDPNRNIDTVWSSFGGAFHVHSESRKPGQAQVIPRGVTHKARLFGQSHWVNGAVSLSRDVFELIEPHLRGDASKIMSVMQRCKSLGRTIKSQQTPSWPLPPTSDLPPKDVVDELVDCYLRTTETIYRILHVPTFRRDYEALWASDTKPDTDFLIQLKLVLALGAITYDEKCSLRTSAIRWVYEAQTWLSGPKYKSRLGIQPLQTTILFLLARERIHAGGDPLWISAGALFRTAVCMGFHRDPSQLPSMTNFVAEMRRRLWNTILEILLQSSLSIGGPPFISLDDFDTEPPRNFDDDQLETENPVPKLEVEFTQVSVAIALRQTFPVRLAVVKFLNDMRSRGTYEETLKLDAELRASYKTLCQTLQRCSSSTGPSPSQLEMRIVDFIMHFYISSIHIPFFGPSLLETTYAFSRKVVLENSLKIWCGAYPSSSIMGAQLQSTTTISTQDELARLVACGSGFYRTVSMAACLLIAIEVRSQLQEEQSIGLVPLRPALLSVLDDAKKWTIRCIEAGETNIKGYLLLCLISAHIEGLMQRLGKDDMSLLLAKAAEDAGERCLPILEELALQGQSQGTLERLHEISLSATPGTSEDWDFMKLDDHFNLGNTEPMSQMFMDDTTNGMSLW